MAEKYSGTYSPDQGFKWKKSTSKKHKKSKNRRIKHAGARRNAIYGAAIVVAATSFNDGAIGLSIGLTAAGCWALAVHLLGQGLIAQDAYNERLVAKRPAIPRKIFAALLIGIGIGLAVIKNEQNPISAAIYGLIGMTLHLVAFGIDPLKDKGYSSDNFQSDRVARAVQDAHERLDKIQSLIKTTRDKHVIDQVEQFSVTASDLFRRVEEDPRDLTAVRKFLTVYLDSASDATKQFSELYSKNKDPEAKAKYLALLEDLDQNFALKTQKLLENDKQEMTIEIDVLRQRLAQELNKL